ncbi:LSU ribosomal protein L33P [Sinobaca qinghaiensis]|uniref:Large ribosomal subunit protein bL33 n=1 Tax=Sinobaca qinghaiensis TaxID=342944 RepID=A0A419UTS4_9BACL|nr:50S ribosomal protein L33 [Sinobaca qinghaiensis]RKD67543.1 LSU ribosomal protein L33P [Sinobaca qinghaiensis]
MREKVGLACTTCLSRNHITEKNKQTQTHRIEMKKFCKHCNAHTLHRETK